MTCRCAPRRAGPAARRGRASRRTGSRGPTGGARRQSSRHGRPRCACSRTGSPGCLDRQSACTAPRGRPRPRRPRLPRRRRSRAHARWGPPAGQPRPASFWSTARSASQDCRKPLDVVQEGRGGRKDLDVAGPAQALVALRAVGGHVEEVAAHAPDDVLVQLVEQRVGAFEPAGALHIRMQHHRGQMSSGRSSPGQPSTSA